MLTSFLTGVSVWMSWMLGLSFIHIKRTALLFHSSITSALAFLACWLLQQAGLSDFLPAVLLGLYLIATASLQLQHGNHYSDSVLAFFLAESAFAMFIAVCRISQTEPLPIVLLVFSGLLFAFLAAWFVLHDRFPGSDWQEYFSSGTPDPSRLYIRRFHIYAVAAIPALCNTLLLFMDISHTWQAILAAAVAFGFLWVCVLMIILMVSYKKERLAVLLEQQYHTEMQAFMNVIRSQRHDYNFHVQTIAGLIAGNKIEACRDYVQALEKDSSDMNALLPVKDPALAATISSFRTIAAREGITMHIDIENDLSQIASNVYETNKILSNLLQNAIDEVSSHADKSYGIRLTILKRGEFCVIRVSNKVASIPTAEHLGMLYQPGYTTKNQHEGVGLSSIRLLAQRYRGIVYAQTEGDIIHFTAKIPLIATKQGD